VAVACVGMAAEPEVAQRLISFPTKHRAKHTCETCGRSSCEIYKCHCQGFEINRNQGGKGATFSAGVATLFVPSLPIVRGEGCFFEPPLGGWRGGSSPGMENWKWRSALQWRLLQYGYTHIPPPPSTPRAQRKPALFVNTCATPLLAPRLNAHN
jgi:hypothetical protein